LPEPHELGNRLKDASEDKSDDYTINVEVWRNSLLLNVQGSAEETRSHPSQKSEICSRNLRRVQNRKRNMRSGIIRTNGNERRKHDEERNKNTHERKSPYQMINRHIRRLCNETRFTKTHLHTSGRTSRTNGYRWKKSGETPDYIRTP
jgi:hypothetical protein